MKFLFFLAIALSSNIYAQNLRYDGVYVKIKDTSSITAPNEYLRFYKYGDIITTTTSTGSPQEIKKWFNLENKTISKGNFNLKNNTISFLIELQEGAIQYTGEILKDGVLDLEITSYISDKTSHDKFRFINQAEIDQEKLD